MRVAFILVSRSVWTGGYNYLLNLVRALSIYESEQITSVIFVGEDFDESQLAPFRTLGAKVVRSAVFDQTAKSRLLARALLLGRDGAMNALFEREQVDAIFEVGRFYGWRLRPAVIAWIPDLQHRLLPQFYTALEYWKRECGFQVQVRRRRTIMLSSEDARKHCEGMYPQSRGKTSVVHFAVPPTVGDGAQDLQILRRYHLPEFFFFLPNQYWQHKNHECVIRAVKIAKEAGRGLVVASSGNPRDLKGLAHITRLQNLVAELGVGEYFRFLGMIPGADVGVLMRACAALINPSVCEGWSTTVEEAKVAGTPMILSDIGVHREQTDGNALFFDPAKPETLAAILITYAPPSAQTRKVLAACAADRSELSMRQFAADFTRTVRGAVAAGRNR